MGSGRSQWVELYQIGWVESYRVEGWRRGQVRSRVFRRDQVGSCREKGGVSGIIRGARNGGGRKDESGPIDDSSGGNSEEITGVAKMVDGGAEEGWEKW